MRMKQIAAPTMLVALFVAVLVQVSFAIAERASDYDFFDTLIDIRHLLLDRYVVAPDEKELQEAAIEAAEAEADGRGDATCGHAVAASC